MFERIILTQLNDHVWLMDDAHEATGYLIVGANRALVVDTMNGHEDVLQVVRSITDLPVTVVNTHGHCDHIFGNIFFDEAYLHPADLPVAEGHCQMPDFQELCREKGLTMPPFREIHGGDVIDLGGLTAEIIDCPGHTPGGVLVLLREDRILFTGDSINRHTWMQLDHSLQLKDFLKTLEGLACLKDRADYIAHGHARSLDPISLLDDHRRGVRELVEQEGTSVTSADPDYTWFGGVCKQHPFAPESVIVYTVDKLD